MYRRYRQAKQKNSVPILPTSSSSKEVERKLKHLSWVNIALNASIPLMIGIVTVVITVRQQQLDDRRQQQERELDDRRYHLEHEQADELHYQDVFKTYITDISNTIFKQPQQQQQQQTTFIDNKTKLAYIKSQTLVALNDLDWKRKTRLFLFLYENKLLPRIPLEIHTSNMNQLLDLTGANLANITIESSTYKSLRFDRLSLPSADLTDASFRGTTFADGVSFHLSIMVNIKFTGSIFQCLNRYQEDIQTSLSFQETRLTRAAFQNTQLCDILFSETDLAYANFSGAQFKGITKIFSTNLIFTDFRHAEVFPHASIHIMDADMTGASIFHNIEFQKALNDGRLQLGNVIFPNGTWKIDTSNLIRNGDAELNCSPEVGSDIYFWLNANPEDAEYPTISINENFNDIRFGKCYYNFTVIRKEIELVQLIDMTNFSCIVSRSEVKYELMIDANCINGDLSIRLFFSNKLIETLFESESFINGTEELQWITHTYTGKIPVNTRHIRVSISRKNYADVCYIDNIKLYIRRDT
ncbi:hypothetical protein I4U23_013027 [Adineta vaga]|nr:hypothetical protein I4U23_013027 [Adineta vaga]